MFRHDSLLKEHIRYDSSAALVYHAHLFGKYIVLILLLSCLQSIVGGGVYLDQQNFVPLPAIDHDVYLVVLVPDVSLDSRIDRYHRFKARHCLLH